MQDAEIVQQIHDLVTEEHALEGAHAGQEASPDDRRRLEELAVQLDRCWDLLRQRRARRGRGDDPDGAGIRPASTVEHYLQ